MLAHALALARRGLFVFPCKPRDKEPATPNGCLGATTDPELITRWWRQNQDFNIAVATGERSRVFVLDVDGDEAEGELRKLEAQHGALPSTVEAITARGRHIYFEWPDRPVRNSVSRLGPDLDIRGEGGYVLAAPSVHPTGRLYTWSVDSAKAFAPAPKWLLAKIANGNGHDATPPSQWRALASGSAEEGCRNDTLARLAGLLLRRGIDAVVVHALLTSWNQTHCRPPLDDAEVATIVSSITARELRRRGISP